MESKLELYERLCAEADALLKQHNPCNIKDGKCVRGYFCCDGCKHLAENRCGIKSLLCKTWLCTQASSMASKELIDGLCRIYRIGQENNMIVFRGAPSFTDDIPGHIYNTAPVFLPWGTMTFLRREVI